MIDAFSGGPKTGEALAEDWSCFPVLVILILAMENLSKSKYNDDCLDVSAKAPK